MIGREGRPLAQVGTQERVSQFAGDRIEVYRRSASRSWREIAGPDLISLRLVQVEVTLFDPIQHRGIVAFGDAWRRQLTFDPICQIGLRDLECHPFPVHRPANQLVRGHGELHPALPVGQLL